MVDAVLILTAGREQDASVGVSDGLPARGLSGHDYCGLVENWDGQWVESIAEDGYPTDLPRRTKRSSRASGASSRSSRLLVRLMMTLTRLPFGPGGYHRQLDGRGGGRLPALSTCVRTW